MPPLSPDLVSNMTNYEETRATFQLTVPEYFNFTTDTFEKWAADPTRVALLVASPRGDRIDEYTFAQLSALANQFAQALLKRGIKKGERVLVMLPRIHQWFAALLGMFKIGVLPIPTTAQCTARDLLYRLEKADVAGVLTDPANSTKFDEIRPDLPKLKFQCLVQWDQAAINKVIANDWEFFDEVTAAESTVFTPAEKTRSSDPLLLYFTSGTVAHP
ncbi:TPA: hypothetical protein DDW35_13565, partial [Candidatus Sumerlaeota bacterium]|nr:hypothetical protein [Candidatus Sumerlaeota bacterium]